MLRPVMLLNGNVYVKTNILVDAPDNKHVVATLLEDSQRLNNVEPNAGTQARIDEAVHLLNSPESFDNPQQLHTIALLLEDARRRLAIEPNAATQARIDAAELALKITL